MSHSSLSPRPRLFCAPPRVCTARTTTSLCGMPFVQVADLAEQWSREPRVGALSARKGSTIRLLHRRAGSRPHLVQLPARDFATLPLANQMRVASFSNIMVPPRLAREITILAKLLTHTIVTVHMLTCLDRPPSFMAFFGNESSIRRENNRSLLFWQLAHAFTQKPKSRPLAFGQFLTHK
jgi:hypothetical protein